MRILLACDIDTNGEGNPFTLQLLHALETHPDVAAVQHGTSWMKIPETTFDIVHIQWPEALVDWVESPDTNDLSEVKSALMRWGGESAIVATVHNEYPHYNDSEAFRSLYKMVYSYADGIVHLGEASKKVMRRRYREEMENAKEAIIPHGNYDWFPDDISQSNARSKLGIGEDTVVFLSVGSIRDMEELNLLLQGFKLADIPDKRLVIATALPHRKRTELRYWTTRLPLWLSSKIKVHESYIPVEEMQYFVNAADAIVIPRMRSLNSGDVALGLTFGRVVIGPNIGVIGEMLRETNNPTFDPMDPHTLGQAMTESVKMAGTDRAKSNQTYAKARLRWSDIADEQLSFYKKIGK